MKAATASAIVLLMGAVPPAQAASEAVEQVAAAMQGGWNRTTSSPEVAAPRALPKCSLSSQIFLEGGVSGVLSVSEGGGGNDLVECDVSNGTYEFSDEKL